MISLAIMKNLYFWQCFEGYFLIGNTISIKKLYVHASQVILILLSIRIPKAILEHIISNQKGQIKASADYQHILKIILYIKLRFINDLFQTMLISICSTNLLFNEVIWFYIRECIKCALEFNLDLP